MSITVPEPQPWGDVVRVGTPIRPVAAWVDIIETGSEDLGLLYNTVKSIGYTSFNARECPVNL